MLNQPIHHNVIAILLPKHPNSFVAGYPELREQPQHPIVETEAPPLGFQQSISPAA